ncbi:hypothetical protein NBRC116494_21290 [Aurantivibrio plasticivorans]
MSRLKPSEEKRLRELAERDKRIAAELQKHDQATAALTDLLTQQKAQNRKARNRELMLLGAAVMSECEVNHDVKKAITKLVNKHLSRISDREFIASRGWEVLENEDSKFTTSDSTVSN